MNWFQRNDKLLTALVLAIGIAFAIYVFFYQKANLTVDLQRIDDIVEGKYWTAYIEFKEIDAVFYGGNYDLFLKLKPEIE